MKALPALAAFCSLALLPVMAPAEDTALVAKDSTPAPKPPTLSANDYLDGLVTNWNIVNFPAYKNHFTKENADSFNPTYFASLRSEYGTWDRSQFLGAIEKKGGTTLYLWKVWFQKKPFPELFKLYVTPKGEIAGLWLQEGS